jgi:hypothetical protein
VPPGRPHPAGRIADRLAEAGRLTAAGRLAAAPAWVPLLLVALAVRLPGLTTKPLWYDEALAVLLSTQGPAALVESTLAAQGGVAANVHPPGYFVLLWLWARLVGDGPGSVRSLSVLLGVATVAVGYWLAREAFGASTGRTAGWLLALSPFQVHYSQEVRMYALLSLELTAAAAVFRTAMTRGGALRWLGFAALAAAAQYTHALAALFLTALALIPVWRRQWKQAARAAAAGIVALLLYSPWLVHLPAQVARVRQAYWISPPGPADVIRTLVTFIGGSPLASYMLAPVLFTALLLLGLGSWALLRGSRSGSPDAHHAGWAAYLALAPMALLFLVSLWRPVYLDRSLLPAGVAFLVWAGWTLSGRQVPGRLRWTAGALLVISFGLGLASYYSYRGFPYAPFQALVQHLRSNAEPGEIVLHSNKLSAIPAAYYAPDLDQRYLPDAPGSATDTLAPATQRVLGLEAEADIASAVGQAPGVWFVVFRRERDEYARLGYSEHPGLRWLMVHYAWQQTVLFGELELHHFAGAPDRALSVPAGPGAPAEELAAGPGPGRPRGSATAFRSPAQP